MAIVRGRCDFGMSRIGRPFIVGHRGASDEYPENTVLSIEKAIAEGAEGIEFDIHQTLDNEIIVMHDPSLERTTTGKGMVAEKNYFGDIEFLSIVKNPNCSIPRFQDVLDVLLKAENSHIWALIDIKMTISPEIIITLSKILKSRNEDLSVFSKQLTLGLWHPKFISYAKTYLPEIPIIHIGASLEIAKDSFSDVDGYNLGYYALYGDDGRKFIEEVHAKGKPVFVWTVNEEIHAKNCYNWGVDAIMTDKTKFFVELFKNMKNKSEEKVFDVNEESWNTSMYNFGFNRILHWVFKWRLSKVDY